MHDLHLDELSELADDGLPERVSLDCLLVLGQLLLFSRLRLALCHAIVSVPIDCAEGGLLAVVRL